MAVHKETGDVTAASMFVKTNNIIQYHLSGTRTDYMKIAPSRLLLDEMRIIGTREGYSYFNLGGGYRSQEDALFEFKSSFSGDFKAFKVWTFIVDAKKYAELTQERKGGNTSFFPAYRAK
jgi:lipid II:glycine glycyltransferase (peptidoglycan interpeptide bridge formation enzyme)